MEDARHRTRMARKKALIDARGDIADLKHAYRAGIRAQPGIDL